MPVHCVWRPDRAAWAFPGFPQVHSVGIFLFPGARIVRVPGQRVSYCIWLPDGAENRSRPVCRYPANRAGICISLDWRDGTSGNWECSGRCSLSATCYKAAMKVLGAQPPLSVMRVLLICKSCSRRIPLYERRHAGMSPGRAPVCHVRKSAFFLQSGSDSFRNVFRVGASYVIMKTNASGVPAAVGSGI